MTGRTYTSFRRQKNQTWLIGEQAVRSIFLLESVGAGFAHQHGAGVMAAPDTHLLFAVLIRAMRD